MSKACPYSSLSFLNWGSIPQHEEQMGSVKYNTRIGFSTDNKRTFSAPVPTFDGISHTPVSGSHNIGLFFFSIIYSIIKGHQPLTDYRASYRNALDSNIC